MTDKPDALRAYSARSAEHIELLGDIEAMSHIDRERIQSWATALEGRVIDAGSGPGHWTAHLHGLGVDIEGIDMVAEFVASASARFPQVRFRQGRLEALPIKDGGVAGILSWYSVIHAAPADLPVLLAEFARCLAPGGSLLLGFFEGPRNEAFEHAVTAAYFWPVEEMTRELELAGFRVLDVSTRTDPGRRSHADISAVLR